MQMHLSEHIILVNDLHVFVFLAGLWVWSSTLRGTFICLRCEWMEFCEELLQVILVILVLCYPLVILIVDIHETLMFITIPTSLDAVIVFFWLASPMCFPTLLVHLHPITLLISRQNFFSWKSDSFLKKYGCSQDSFPQQWGMFCYVKSMYALLNYIFPQQEEFRSLIVDPRLSHLHQVTNSLKSIWGSGTLNYVSSNTIISNIKKNRNYHLLCMYISLQSSHVNFE